MALLCFNRSSFTLYAEHYEVNSMHPGHIWIHMALNKICTKRLQHAERMTEYTFPKSYLPCIVAICVARGLTVLRLPKAEAERRALTYVAYLRDSLLDANEREIPISADQR